MLMAETPITWTDLVSVFTSLQSQFSIPNMVGVIGGALTIAIVFVFMWWGLKKGMSIIRTAMNSGTLSTGGKSKKR